MRKQQAKESATFAPDNDTCVCTWNWNYLCTVSDATNTGLTDAKWRTLFGPHRALTAVQSTVKLWTKANIQNGTDESLDRNACKMHGNLILHEVLSFVQRTSLAAQKQQSRQRIIWREM
jgi:hypothetical protein